jgi:hypothetical protein
MASLEVKLFFIVNMERSEGRECFVWWGADSNGYTDDIASAGIYTQQEIDNLVERYGFLERNVVVPADLVRDLTTVGVKASGQSAQTLFAAGEKIRREIQQMRKAKPKLALVP